ncbi:glycosyltransferase [Streptococcus suis]|uniref:glycosyltransferase n=1 Tax=Streptococcus suis TaxID=1307 RepID=UPI000CF563D8|nr:glycosyltransferase [Streptococcus suis]HEM3473077.1 glycosyltransferase [Streptococcus suis]HEM3477295.1 glycosyltransferase [Streptococcus suis]HEM3483756.1 glycosyltransferase [Streptococcus suis]HEM3544852.1 glycosyltransferase [Streptococcus suis]
MFEEKRFLLTHIWLRGFGGAELNILELAEYLQQEGAIVEVFTYLFLEPMRSEFEKRNIKVITDREHVFSLEDYDFIISCQNILPNSIVKSLREHHSKFPKIIFLHMAALKSHVLEQPFVFGLESRLSSGTLAISQEVVDKNLSRFFNDIPRLFMYQNPVPVGYAVNSYSNNRPLKKILIISNHPPSELKELQSWFDASGIIVDYAGVWSSKYELASPEMFSEYDCIIGIGKNVQYCLVLGKPIYVYDHFAGPGFLNSKNFEKAEYHNFSGRGFEDNQKSPQEIFEDIMENYDDAKKFYTENVEFFRKKYQLSNVLPQLIEQLENDNKEIQLFSVEYSNYVLAMNNFIGDIVVRLENDVNNLWQGIRDFEERVDDLNLHIQYLNEMIALKEQEVVENQLLVQELRLIYKSKTYKLAVFLQKMKNGLLKIVKWR